MYRRLGLKFFMNAAASSAAPRTAATSARFLPPTKHINIFSLRSARVPPPGDSVVPSAPPRSSIPAPIDNSQKLVEDNYQSVVEKISSFEISQAETETAPIDNDQKLVEDNYQSVVEKISSFEISQAETETVPKGKYLKLIQEIQSVKFTVEERFTKMEKWKAETAPQDNYKELIAEIRSLNATLLEKLTPLQKAETAPQDNYKELIAEIRSLNATLLEKLTPLQKAETAPQDNYKELIAEIRSLNLTLVEKLTTPLENLTAQIAKFVLNENLEIVHHIASCNCPTCETRRRYEYDFKSHKWRTFLSRFFAIGSGCAGWITVYNCLPNRVHEKVRGIGSVSWDKGSKSIDDLAYYYAEVSKKITELIIGGDKVSESADDLATHYEEVLKKIAELIIITGGILKHFEVPKDAVEVLICCSA